MSRRTTDVDGSRDAKVGKLHSAARVEQDVSGLQVAMHNAPLVGVLQRLGNLDEHRNDLEVPCTAKAPQVAARGKLHGQRNNVARALGREDLQYCSVAQPIGDLVFPLKSGPGGFVARERRAENLQRDIDAAHLIVRAAHLSLTARTKSVEQRVAGVQPASSGGSQNFCHSFSRIARNI